MAPAQPHATRQMNVSLTRELADLVHEKVRSGLYQSASEVVRGALRLFQQREQIQHADLRRKVAEGLSQLDCGEGVPGEQVFREIRRKGAARRTP